MLPAAPAGWGAALWPASPPQATTSSPWTATPSPPPSCPTASSSTRPTSWRRGRQLRLLRETAPDAVVHLAAIAVPFSAPEDVIFSTNTRLAYAVISAATELRIGKIVTASSPTVLGYGSPAGWLPESFPVDEDTTPKPWNAYALSKLIAEQTVQMFAAAQGDAIRYAAFRPCYVISPEEWDGAPTQQGHTVRERLADPALSAPALFNYVDARDVADFLDLLLARRWTPSPTARPSSWGPPTRWPPHRFPS